MESRVILVRHGRTALNAEGRLRGLANPELDDLGIVQAHAAAEALRTVGLAEIHSSPLRRAVLTAEIIAAASGIANQTDPTFNDRDYGPWTGHLKTEVVAQWGSVDAAPGVEDSVVVRDRAMKALNAVVALGGSGAIAVVTHDAVIRPILETIEPGIHAEVDNCSWAELAWTDGTWKVLSVDNTA
jgi:broad specificity phosphatase PhoE